MGSGVKAQPRAVQKMGRILKWPRDGSSSVATEAFAAELWQTQVLESSSTRKLLNCTRQTGKSTSTALLSIHTAHYSADGVGVKGQSAQSQAGLDLERSSLKSVISDTHKKAWRMTGR